MCVDYWMSSTQRRLWSDRGVWSGSALTVCSGLLFRIRSIIAVIWSNRNPSEIILDHPSISVIYKYSVLLLYIEINVFLNNFNDSNLSPITFRTKKAIHLLRVSQTLFSRWNLARFSCFVKNKAGIWIRIFVLPYLCLIFEQADLIWANSVDPDQMLIQKQFDNSLHYFSIKPLWQIKE